MFKLLRITFTVLSCLCVAALIPLAVFTGWTGAIICGLVACLFFAATAFFKKLQEKQETPPEEPRGDFFNPLPKRESSNEETKEE